MQIGRGSMKEGGGGGGAHEFMPVQENLNIPPPSK